MRVFESLACPDSHIVRALILDQKSVGCLVKIRSVEQLVVVVRKDGLCLVGSIRINGVVVGQLHVLVDKAECFVQLKDHQQTLLLV